MKPTIKVNFEDFWPGYDKTNNYFYNLLIQNYKVVIDEENPEILFYSRFGIKYLKYKCKRVLYLGENFRPDLTACDLAFSFDFNSNKRHFRLPLYSLYIEGHKMFKKSERKISREEAVQIWKSKTKFCCMVVSNPACKERIDFYHNLSKVKHVDSGGRYLNNVDGPVLDKLEFIKDYKFVLSFENSIHDGYTTEKVLEPLFMNSIPVYWGNKMVHKDFNAKRFVNYFDFQSEEEVIQKLLEIDSNDELGIQMIMEPPFNAQKVTHEQERQQVLDKISKLIQSKKTPIAQTFWSYLHLFKLKIKHLKKIAY